MERVFQNIHGTAFLDRGVFPDRDLLNACVSYAEPLLMERPEIVLYGKTCKQHRNVGFFSDESVGYKYSNQLMGSRPLSEPMVALLAVINSMLGTEFNGILVNKYMDGNDYIGAHCDDKRGLDGRGVVAISFGSERIFRIRDKNTKAILRDEPTAHCGILHMGGNFQTLYTHEIPVQKKIKGSRISFSFRKHRI